MSWERRQHYGRTAPADLSDPWGRGQALVHPVNGRTAQTEWYTCQPDDITFEILTWTYDPGDEFTAPHVDVTFAEGDPDWTPWILSAYLVSIQLDGFEGTLTLPGVVTACTSTSATIELTDGPEDPDSGTGGEFVVDGRWITLNPKGYGSTGYMDAAPPATFRLRDTEQVMEDGIRITVPSLLIVCGLGSDAEIIGYTSGTTEAFYQLLFDINADTAEEINIVVATAMHRLSGTAFLAQCQSPTYQVDDGDILTTGRLRVGTSALNAQDFVTRPVRLVVCPVTDY